MNDMLQPGVSVVICCYNSGEVIVPTIESLSQLTIPSECGYEVIIVDNNCTDNTVQLARKAWRNSTKPLHIIKETQPGLIYARKKGVLQAHYDIILFVDDDNILEPDWVERLIVMYSKNPEIGGIGGFNEPLFEEGVEKPSWFENFSSMYACTAHYENPEVSSFKQTLYGAGLSLRTNVARSVFDSNLPFFLVGRKEDALTRGDDSEICLRVGLMGWKLWYESTLKLKHTILRRRVKWEYVLQARREGGHADIILKIYRDLLEENIPLEYSQLSVYISSLWEEFWQKRLKKRDMLKLRNEGDNVALRYNFLLGLTEGLLETREDEYASTRQSIIEFFQKR
jgi:glycosyltransferase involved in cell wall biosynthesis